jgi:hypothetical protein
MLPYFESQSGAWPTDGGRLSTRVTIRDMVERIRQSKIYGFLAAVCLEFLAMFVHSAQDDDTPAEESMSALHEKQLTQTAPPPTFTAPSLGRPWFDSGPQPLGGISSRRSELDSASTCREK